MQFSAFIYANLDAIVSDWEAFARTLLPAATSMSDVALRNHSREILIAIVRDMRTSQTEIERFAKSTPTDLAPAASETIAAAHGAMRLAAGFQIAQVVSEFRALRSNVLARWRRFETTRGAVPAIEEIARFNEAIDQMLAESVQRYSSDLAASKDMFLAIVGHDLRSPLHTIELASYALAAPALPEPERLKVARRVRRASTAMGHLIADLLAFTRRRLGRAIPIERAACDLGAVCDEALEDVRAGELEQDFVLHRSGDLNIHADRLRLLQMLSNLLNNAVQHGDKRAPVSLSARGDQAAIVLVIANAGKPIPPEALSTIFEPLVQGPTNAPDMGGRSTSGLGLGLFIVREIVLGHHGTIDVQSSADSGTAFTIRLPRTTSCPSQ